MSKRSSIYGIIIILFVVVTGLSLEANASGAIQYEDDVISYSWDGKVYEQQIFNDFPELTKTEGSINYTFAVISEFEGLEESELMYYAAEAKEDYYYKRGLPEGTLLGYTMATERELPEWWNDYSHYRTGVNYCNDEWGIFSYLYVLSTQKHSVAFVLSVTGSSDDVMKVFENDYEGGQEQYLVEQEMKDILDTFMIEGEHLVKDIISAED